MTHLRNQKSAWIYGILAYIVWGGMPLYWRLFEGTPSLVVFMHRCIWSFPFLVLVSFVGARQSNSILVLDRGRWPWLVLSGLLIGSNWWLYIYGVGKHQVVEMSLGYFFAPLLTAALGVLFLREKLTIGQWIGVILVMFGVVAYSLNIGHVPLLAIGLAVTFSGYSLVRKLVKAPPLSALTSEAAVLFVIAVFYFVTTGNDAVAMEAWNQHSWKLMVGGALTAIPLLWFAHAVRGLTLTSLGMINYISPTGKFLIAILLLGEVVSVQELWAFIILWIGVIIYLASTFKRGKIPPQPE